MYRKGQPTATLIYEDSRREVVQQCIANLMSTFHVYPHSEVIASSFTERFEDVLRWLYKTDKANRDSCKHRRGWSREKFVEHLRLLYPQLSNAADKSYLEMIKEIPFQYDLDNPILEFKFQSELFKIVKHYDSLTITEEAEAVKILLGKINIPNVYNWIPIFNEMATGCDVPIPVTIVGDFRFVLSTCSFKEKIHQNPAINHLVFRGLSLFCATSVVRTITLTPIVVREPQSSRTIKSVLMSVRRPIVG